MKSGGWNATLFVEAAGEAALESLSEVLSPSDRQEAPERDGGFWGASEDASIQSESAGLPPAPPQVGRVQRLGGEGSGFPSTSRGGLSWLLGLAFALIVVYTTMAESRVAAAEAAQTAERKHVLGSKERLKAIEAAIQAEEAFARRAAEELQALEQQKQAGQATLEMLVQRRADIRARVAKAHGPAAQVVRPVDAEEATARLQAAKRDRDNVIYDLDAALMLKEVTPESASDRLQRIRAEKELWIEREAKAERLLLLETGDLEAAKARLAALEAELVANRQEIQELERQATLLAAQTEAEDALDEDIAVLEKELTAAKHEHNLLSLRSIGLRGLNDSLSLRAEEIQDATERCKTQLEQLARAPAVYSKKELLLQQAQQDLREQEQKILDVVSSVETAEEPESEDIAGLFPEEKLLLDARQMLHRKESQLVEVEAESALWSDERVRVALARTFLELIKAKLSASGEVLSPGSSTDPPPRAPVTDEAKGAVLRMAQHLSELQHKKNRLNAMAADLKEQLVTAKDRVQLYTSQAAAAAKKLPLRMTSPGVFAFAVSSQRQGTLLNMEDLLGSLRQTTDNFGPEFISKMASTNKPRQFWLQYGTPLADEYLTAITEMCKQHYAIRVAARKAKSEIEQKTLVEVLQKAPLNELMASVARGPEAPQQRYFTAKRWRRIRDGIGALQTQIEHTEASVERVQQRLADLTAARWWANHFPQMQVHSEAYIVKQKQRLQYYKHTLAELQAITKADVQEQVRELFVQAVWVAKERRERFGTEEDVLNSISFIHDLTRRNAIAQLDFLVEECVCREEEFAKGVPLAQFPRVVRRSEPAPLEAITIENVMQLRKPSRRRKSPN